MCIGVIALHITRISKDGEILDSKFDITLRGHTVTAHNKSGRCLLEATEQNIVWLIKCLHDDFTSVATTRRSLSHTPGSTASSTTPTTGSNASDAAATILDSDTLDTDGNADDDCADDRSEPDDDADRDLTEQVNEIIRSVANIDNVVWLKSRRAFRAKYEKQHVEFSIRMHKKNLSTIRNVACVLVAVISNKMSLRVCKMLMCCWLLVLKYKNSVAIIYTNAIVVFVV